MVSRAAHREAQDPDQCNLFTGSHCACSRTDGSAYAFAAAESFVPAGSVPPLIRAIAYRSKEIALIGKHLLGALGDATIEGRAAFLSS